MTESWIDLDGVPERELPGHAADGRTGDRVSFLDAGLLHVRDARATFVRWEDVLGLVEHVGGVYVLVPRRPPAPPWIEVSRAMTGTGPDALRAFRDRVEARGSGQGGGYRDAVRRRRQQLSLGALRDKVVAREAVAGALEVPSTIMLGVSYPGLAAVQVTILSVSMLVGYVAIVAFMIAAGPASGEAEPLVTIFGYAIFLGLLLLGAWSAVVVGRRWREAKNRTLPRQRVLVLAPDGCIAGFRAGVRTLAWSEIGSFSVGRDPETYDEALLVTSASNELLGSIQADWLDAPLDLVVRVAQAYRDAALPPD